MTNSWLQALLRIIHKAETKQNQLKKKKKYVKIRKLILHQVFIE